MDPGLSGTPSGAFQLVRAAENGPFRRRCHFGDFGRFGALEPEWTGAGRRTPTAQYGELGQAKPQACVRATESEFSAVGMAVGRVLDASPQTAGDSRGSGAILRLLEP